MSFEIIIAMSVVSVLSALFFTMRVFSWKTIIQYHWITDIIFTGTLVFLFQGTLGGMLVAALSGLLFSIILSVGRLITPRTEGDPIEGEAA